MLRVTNISKRFGDFSAVKKLSFEVRPGEVLGFLGPNGAGKTTSMRIITGFLSADEGNVEINKLNLNDNNNSYKSLIGYLPEGVPMYHEFTPRMYLRYIASMRRVKKIENKINTISKELHLKDVIDVPIETLSKGFKRRVGLAQALIHDPECLILDEPTDGLDPLQKYEVRKLIRKISEKKMILISTHILEEVPEVCNRCLIINKGKKIYDGDPVKLFKNKKKTLDQIFREKISA